MHVSKHPIRQRLKFRRGNQTPPKFDLLNYGDGSSQKKNYGDGRLVLCTLNASEDARVGERGGRPDVGSLCLDMELEEEVSLNKTPLSLMCAMDWSSFYWHVVVYICLLSSMQFRLHRGMVVNVKETSSSLEWKGSQWLYVLFGSPMATTWAGVPYVASQIGRNQFSEI